VTKREYQKALLTAKIDAHRKVLGLELRASRAAFDPLGIVLSLMGVDRALVKLLPLVLRAVTASVRGHPESSEGTET